MRYWRYYPGLAFALPAVVVACAMYQDSKHMRMGRREDREDGWIDARGGGFGGRIGVEDGLVG